MTLLIKSGGSAAFPEWLSGFRGILPQLTVREWDDPNVDPESVRYALVWQPEPGRLARYPNLQVIFSSAAGVDHILADSELPPDCPIVRMVMPETRQMMAEFVAMAALMLMRRMPYFIRLQQASCWGEPADSPQARRRHVGIMGLGALGAHVAHYLRQIGFQVNGWSRDPKSLSGIDCFAGQAQLPAFLAATDILVCLLPDTKQTRGIINTPTLNALPRGSSFINVGRGTHVVEEDLLAALNGGQLRNALLDVFAHEPPDEHSPFWRHPQVIMTPHCAASPSYADRARHVAGIIADYESGHPLRDCFNRSKGY
ncbi:2-hydroxyacid dehydrogenase [Brenneria goodwinii]|uniref:D-3-phosphoglycerate dehydrogenase n=1 Tax=Brenneria goodwinii TaxID=1109412 RepID=A0A0G4JYP5_9GAMM|nr:glyoxylate/hydroxypyruvate reductase A [Brenneria goodwinii]CPR18636.1 D-3-phosphoglycerate dehydrogenase [Brenneria goodwinii]